MFLPESRIDEEYIKAIRDEGYAAWKAKQPKATSMSEVGQDDGLPF